MPTDLTGTPTSLGIGTINPDVDAPSGLGFNAAMAQIDALIAARVSKPSGIAIGEVPVWDGTAFVRPTAQKIGISNLSPGSDGEMIVTAGGVVTWGAGSAGLVPATTLPGSPTDHEQALLVDSLTLPTYAWLFQYDASITDANKWVFIGGSPALSEVAAAEATSSTTYAALTTPGPSFALPRAGVYVVDIGFVITTNGGAGQAFMSYDIGGTGAVDADAAQVSMSSTVFGSSASRAREKTVAAAVTLTAKYHALTAVSNTFANRWMRVTPVRVS